MPSEASIVQACLAWLNAVPGCHAEKQHGSVFGQQRLDLLGCYQGRMFWIEVKQPGKVPTKLQEYTLAKWATFGAWCCWVDSKDQLVAKFIQEFRQG